MKQKVISQFSRSVAQYHTAAAMQREAADALAQYLPTRAQDVLEIGCGTGFLTKHLANRYPDARFTITDISAPMIQECLLNVSTIGKFLVMDGEMPTVNGPFDLIASGLTFQWFENFERSFKALTRMLSKNGALVFSTIGHKNFYEWQQSLKAGGYKGNGPTHIRLDQLQKMGTFEMLAEDFIPLKSEDGKAFVQHLRDIGIAATPDDYRPLTPKELTGALRHFEKEYGATATYHVIYGVWRK